MKNHQLRVLIVEDSETDMLLMVRQLQHGGYEPQALRVEAAAELSAALAAQEWDVVISDYRLPQFTGLDALRLVQATGRDIPFILVSGAIGEDQAVAAMKAGAHDYVLKDSLTRLAPAVERELRDAEVRRQRRLAVEALHELNATLEQRVAERTAALEESEARFRQMAENVQEVFWLADSKLTRMLYVSPAFEKIWGRSCQSLCENPKLWFEAVHPDDRDRVQLAFLRRRSARRTPPQAEYRIVRPDGTIRWILDHGAPIRDKAGRVYRVAGVARDITERKEAELAKARLAAIIESSTDAIFAMQLDGVITDWTRSAERLFGYTATEAVGQPVRLITPPDKQDDLTMFLRKLMGGEPIEAYETVRVRKDGQRLVVAMTVSPVLDAAGRTVGASSITRDITEHKRLEAEIQHISEIEKQRLGRDLHDGLTQQLAGLRLLACDLEAALAQKSLAEAVDAAQIVRELETAAKQTHDIAQGLYPVVLQRGGLVPALQELAANVTSVRKVSCRVVAPRDIHFDNTDAARQLYRIAQEAINNAIKHGHGKVITVQLVEQNGRIILTVHDDGVGISKQAMKHPGMGLRILQYRAGILNADLTIARAPGGGTQVSCSYPSPTANHGVKH